MNAIHITAAALVLATAPASAVELTHEEFERLHAALTPKDEVWKTIPWHTKLRTAQRQAAQESKLLFLWAMDGHPLGCT